MDSKELRIGNYINAGYVRQPKNRETDERVVKRVTGITPMFVFFDEKVGPSVGQCDPILLTEDWFNKFSGLDPFIAVRGSEYLWIVWDKEENGCVIENDHDLKVFSPPIKYVHQLQNLYFALTGNELEIK